MVAQCAPVIKGLMARLVKLDSCGAPVTGAQSAVVTTKGFIRIAPSPQYEDGEEFFTRRADGSACINEQDPPELKSVDLTIDFCEIDPDGLVIVTGERLLTSGGVTGTGVAFGEGVNTTRFSLEVWQKVAGRAACTPAGLQRYVYWAFMNVGNGRVGDLTFENAALTFTVTAETYATSLLWGNGPGSAGPWIDGVVEDGEHFLFNITTVAPPTAACGAVLLA